MIISGHPLWFISKVGIYFLSVLDLCMSSQILLTQMEGSVEIFKILAIISRVQNEVMSPLTSYCPVATVTMGNYKQSISVVGIYLGCTFSGSC